MHQSQPVSDLLWLTPQAGQAHRDWSAHQHSSQSHASPGITYSTSIVLSVTSKSSPSLVCFRDSLPDPLQHSYTNTMTLPLLRINEYVAYPYMFNILVHPIYASEITYISFQVSHFHTSILSHFKGSQISNFNIIINMDKKKNSIEETMAVKLIIFFIIRTSNNLFSQLSSYVVYTRPDLSLHQDASPLW